MVLRSVRTFLSISPNPVRPSIIPIMTYPTTLGKRTFVKKVPPTVPPKSAIPNRRRIFKKSSCDVM